MVEDHSIEITNKLEDLQKVTAFFEELAEQWNLEMKLAMNLNLCLEEALTNVIFYAYPDGKTGSIEVTFGLEPNEVFISIEDHGIAFNPLTDSEAPDLNTTIEDRKVGGLGIHFIKQFMDKVQYQRMENKNQLTFSKSI